MSLKHSLHSVGMRHAADALDEIVAEAMRDSPALPAMLERLIAAEHHGRRARSFQRRLGKSRLGAARTVDDFDWAHPRHIDRAVIEQALSLRFVDEGGAVLFFGPPGVGKTHLARALCMASLLAGHRVIFVTQRALCEDLAQKDTSSALERRLRHYEGVHVLCIDEVAQGQCDLRRLDLLYEVVRRRYENKRAMVTTATLPFSQWPSAFQSTAATAALIDRLVHRASVVEIDADSYRRKEAMAQAAKRR